MDRIDKLRQQMLKLGLDAFFISSPENRRYLSGFTGTEGYLLITHQQCYILTDFRYLEQAAAQAPKFLVHKIGFNPYAEISELASEFGHLAFEGNILPYTEFLALRDALPQTELKSCPEVLDNLRAIKDETEIKVIRQAVDIADHAFAEIIKTIKPGQTEEEISLNIEFLMRKAGASGRSFDFIVASGVRSSLPHGVATSKQVADGELIILDFGAIFQGYCSDITRTVMLGEPNERQLEIYNTVLQAQLLGIKSVAPGRTGLEVDQVVRNFIRDAGYDGHFGHGLGHSLGLAIHESPRLNTRDETVLEPGMIVTVEPGIYLPDWGGVRIEDIVLVTETGCEVLTKAPKELIIIN